MIKIDNPDLEKGLEEIIKASGYSPEETVENRLIADLARESAWGQSLNIPQPGWSFIKHADGTRLRGDELYQEVYRQMRVFINNLLLGEKLLVTLIEICRKADLLGKIEGGQKAAINCYIEKIEKNSYS